MKMGKKEFGFALVLLAALLLIGGVHATTVSNAQTSLNSFVSSLTGSSSASGGSMCSQGQDFAIQISPLGCEPVDVRSDLLEQQDVQVYCPLMATQLNPSVNVQAIDSISFQGTYPKEVRSIGFYPAQAALSAGNQLTNSPVLNNIGYVVIDLKQQPNESSMPDSVNGTLTASLKYDANKALGIGTVQHTIPQLSDSSWQTNYPEYSFWGGKGYVKIDNIQGNQATISIYNKNLNKVSSATLQAGQTSSAMAIPGSDLCSATMNVKLDDVQGADTMAKLEVNGNTLSIAKGDSFIDNMCQIRNIDKQGLVQDVQVTCNTDAGYKTFDLTISPRVTVDINGTKKEVGIGDYLFTVPNGDLVDKGKSVYLGYIDYRSAANLVSSDKNSVNNIYLYLAVLAKTPAQFEDKMTSDELSSFTTLARLVTPTQMAKNPILSVGLNAFKGIAALFDSLTQFTVGGTDLAYLQYGVPNPIFMKEGIKVNFTGFASSSNYPINATVQTIYNQANGDYNTIQNSYSGETYPSGDSATLGEKTLYQQINMTYSLGQKTSVQSLCDEFKKDYPNSDYDLSKFCNNGAVLSSQGENSQYVTINGQAYQITLDGISEPSLDDFSAVVSVKFPDGHTEPITLSKDQIWMLNVSTGDYIQLDSLGDGTATLNTPAGILGSGSMTLKQNVPATLGQATGVFKSKNVYTLTLTHVSLKQYAKVEIIPNINNRGSKANFNFSIGIEKRSIKLNPEQTQNLIKNLDGTISTLDKISGFTGKAVNLSKVACQVAGLGLTAINFLNNLGGKGLARTEVMTGAGGWNDKCTSMVNSGKYSTLDQCFLDNSKQIDADVNQTAFLMGQQDKQVNTLQSKYTTTPQGLKSILSSGVVDTNKFMQDYSADVQSSLNCLQSDIANPSSKNAKAISLSDAKTLLSYDSYSKNNFNVNQAKDVQLYSQILCSSSSSASLKATAQQGLYNTLSNIQTNAGNYAAANKIAASTGVNPDQVGQIIELNDNVKKYTYLGLTVSGLDSAAAATLEGTKDLNGNTITASTPAYIAPAGDGNTYIFVMGNTYQSSIMPVTGVYDTNGKPAKESVVKSVVGKIEFQKADASSYQNPYKANQGSTKPEVQYFETDPYKGFPAIVPFDLKNGWYAAIKQTTAAAVGSSTSSYDNSGRVESFYLCNVGTNGIEEFNSQTGDDSCQGINLGAGTTYGQFGGITDAGQVSKLVSQAQQAISSAASQYKSGVSSVIINGQRIEVGSPAVNTPAIQCQDFMSPTDCNILFNACDPYVCPPSRCDFGGAYHVQDVVQSGVAGSILLCLPNVREKILVPVCLTGIQAGLENWISVLNSSRDCLQNQLKTGQTTGICNEIESVYMCNLFWSEAAPIAGIAIPKIAESVLGQNRAQGGGEYSNFQNAVDTAKQSESYITNLYASSLPKSFASGTVDVGKAVCKNFVSAVFPDEANLVNQLGTTDSPPQYTGSFNTIPYTTSTVPPQSQYQVYYHIYAGKNSGVYYSIYLEGSGSSYYQDTSSPRMVDSGYISAGGTEDQTKDFTAPTGYTKLCINVNGQEDCGFQRVSSSLAANYVQDSFVANQVNNTNIKTEQECTSGTIDLASLLNLNAQAGLQNLIHPSIQSLGITRICATKNPGLGTDPNANAQNSRWVQTGTCADLNMGCWLDTQSVQNAINSPDIAAYLSNGTTTTLQNSTLSSINSAYQNLLLDSGQYLTSGQFDNNVTAILKESDLNKRINEINSVFNKVFYNNQKGELYLLRGNAYFQIALNLYRKAVESSSGNNAKTAAITAPATAPGSATASQISASDVLNAITYAQSNAVGTSGQKCNCGTASQCSGYASAIWGAAQAYKEDPLLLLSIMIQESQCNVDTTGGTSVGLMQIDSTSVSDCYQSNDGIPGVSSIADVTGSDNFQKNIQCGALILNKKYSAYGGGQSYTFPAASTGQATCSGFSASYSGWDAAIRGYNGYGCGGDNNYVAHVKSIWNALASKVKPSLVTPTTAVTSYGKAYDDCMAQFNSYAECSKYITASQESTSFSFASPIFQYKNTNFLLPAIYFEYSSGTWHFSKDNKSWYPVSDYSALEGYGSSWAGQNFLSFTQNLNGQTYDSGLALLISDVKNNPGIVLSRPALSINDMLMDYQGKFTVAYDSQGFYFVFDSNNKWEWQPSAGSGLTWKEAPQTGNGIYGEPQDLIKSLDGKNFADGALLIFKSTSAEGSPIVDASASTASYSGTLSNTATTTSTDAATQAASDMASNYAPYKSLFENYSAENVPSGWTQNDYKALLVAIAEENNWGGSNGNLLLGYHPTDSSTQSASDQIRIVSAILKSAFNGNGDSLGWQSGSGVSYSLCNTAVLRVDKVKCVASVYHTSKINTNWFLGLLGNNEGINYANDVVSKWNTWKSYFSS